MIQVKRAYDPAGTDDGARFLVDRLWPRGIKREALKLDGWLKDVAPGHRDAAGKTGNPAAAFFVGFVNAARGEGGGEVAAGVE